ncbi:glycosyltransferase [Rhodococcoides corynebacterioides]|uniref:Glycosyltransferase family 1 protein n=1 Tax=Rhodococcoides corynebacterioides TaxID=53972 RepID=A0ABS7P0E5_9NOCA|nr:glycosyltransferase [Rhodococcus corynebacterioides]MBY6365877.1 glycosyltransferase family 1 protein [Rhodococcus corynebacterioides]MBY6409272.1 glycosyltransferase family 1 protein [Rhodococcus corynebacterioides]
MRVVVAVSGTRGDVQPAAHLAAELHSRSHDVVAAFPPNLLSLASDHGVPVEPFGYDTRAHLASDAVRRGAHGSVIDRVRSAGELWNLGWSEMVADLSAVVHRERPDVVVTGITTEQVAVPLAESVRAAVVGLHHAPVRTNDVHLPGFGADGLPAPVTRAAWSAYETVLWTATRRRENTLRAGLGLPSARRPVPYRLADAGALEIQAYDAALCPPPAGGDGARRPLVGFLGGAPPSSPLPAGLAAWLDRGDPPVHIGFGSMPLRAAGRSLRRVTEAVRSLGLRALVAPGWNDLADDDALGTAPDVRVLTGDVDHAAVFPRCCVVVHHGGAGTTAAVLRAGRPAVVRPVSADQPFWGRRLEDAGAGVMLRGDDPSPAAWAAAIESAAACSDEARRVGDALVDPEDAVARAADLVESRLPVAR